VICWFSTGVWVEKHHLILDYLILGRRVTVAAEVVCVDHKPEVRSDPLVHVLIARGLASKTDWEGVMGKGVRRERAGKRGRRGKMSRKEKREERDRRGREEGREGEGDKMKEREEGGEGEGDK